MNWIEFKDRFNRFGWFSKKELWYVVLLVIIFSFIFSFTQWGTDVFDASAGIKNLFIAFCVVGIVVLVHHFVQRAICLLFGFKPNHRIWWPGIILSLLVLFLSNGRLMVFFGAVFSIAMHKAYRLGWHRYGLNLKQQGLIAVSGNIAVILLVCALRLMSVSSAFWSNVAYFSVLFVFFNMLPIPPLDGGLMLLGSRLYFVFLFSALVGFIAFFSYGLITSLFMSILLGLVCWFIFYWYFERSWS